MWDPYHWMRDEERENTRKSMHVTSDVERVGAMRDRICTLLNAALLRMRSRRDACRMRLCWRRSYSLSFSHPSPLAQIRLPTSCFSLLRTRCSLDFSSLYCLFPFYLFSSCRLDLLLPVSPGKSHHPCLRLPVLLFYH
jgi:hypothetical protein